MHRVISWLAVLTAATAFLLAAPAAAHADGWGDVNCQVTRDDPSCTVEVIYVGGGKGTGGGSGGGILLEGATLMTTGATLQVNGGNGGRNGSYAGIFNCGGRDGGPGSTSASNAGGNGDNCQGGSPGGGGGYGRAQALDR